MTKVDVDTGAFLRDLYDLRKIGAFKTGVSRPTYSPQDMESRRWLMARMQELGLEASIDGIGNVFGRGRDGGPRVLVGSHIESQLEAGWLDGALGVVAGLALARAGLPVDVCAFADEECHFGIGYLGSRSFIGNLREDEIDAGKSRHDGTSLRAALQAAGLAGLPRDVVDPARYKGFFELHIEQGTRLEAAGLRIGVVTGIVGIWSYRLVFEGRQDHAGGTSMEERRDAGVAAVRLLAAVDEAFPKVRGDGTVWTAGRSLIEPNAPTIIPGRAEIWLHFRDVSLEVMERMEATLCRLIEESDRRGPCRATIETMLRDIPAICDPHMMAALSAAAETHAPGLWREMPSRGGHDAKTVARKLPVAMLFVPSIGGISHHWTENTSDEDLALGVTVLGDGVGRFLAAWTGFRSLPATTAFPVPAACKDDER